MRVAAAGEAKAEAARALVTDAEEVVGVVEVVDVEGQMRLVIVGVSGGVALVVGGRARLGRALDGVESLGWVE